MQENSHSLTFLSVVGNFEVFIFLGWVILTISHV